MLNQPAIFRHASSLVLKEFEKRYTQVLQYSFTRNFYKSLRLHEHTNSDHIKTSNFKWSQLDENARKLFKQWYNQ